MNLYYTLLLAAMLTLSTNTQAFQPKVEIVEQFDDLKMIAFIDKKDIDHGPEWSPNTNEPPLSVGQAIQAVQHFLKTSNASDKVEEIELRPLPKQANRWHYLIKIANQAMKAKHNIYVVLMSGKVIPAMIEPQSYK
ncbi:MAG: hypothetical protein Q9N68_12895 [Gammaproteobacteria bacterium]|nr:hypothetical protein [Gammaproteobacteria bacterium]